MAELTPKHSRRGLDLARDVAALALQAPDVVGQKIVREAVDKLRKLYGFSDAAKRKIIRRSIRNGCHTYEDLVLDTKLPRQEVTEQVRDMEECGEVDLTPMRRNGMAGRRAIYIDLTGKSKRAIAEMD